VAEQWPFESAKRSKDAIKCRWKNVLKFKLDALDDLRLICGSCDERDEAESDAAEQAPR